MYGTRNVRPGRGTVRATAWTVRLLALPRRARRRTAVRRPAADPFAARDALTVRSLHEALR